MNKTQEAVLRYVFGFNDGLEGAERGVGIACRPQRMPILIGSRAHKVALDLVRIGIATLSPTGNGFGPHWLYLERAVQ